MAIYADELVNPYIEFTLVDNSIVNTDILDIMSEYINYTIPFAYYKSNGTLKIRVRADNFDSDYINFTISKNLEASDNVVVKTGNNNYIIRTMNTSSGGGGGTSGTSVVIVRW